MSSTRAFRATAVAGVVAAVALVVAISAGAGARSGQIKNGGTLVIGLAEEPDALDPTLARTFVGRMVFLHMCEKLYDLDAKLHIVPQLAAALPQVSKDKLTYTIKLRSGVKFNDGTPFNAAAVKTSLERHLRELGVSTLVFVGCNFPNCPRASIYEASERDFRVVAVTDAISGMYDRGVAELENIGVSVVTSDELAGDGSW